MRSKALGLVLLLGLTSPLVACEAGGEGGEVETETDSVAPVSPDGGEAGEDTETEAESPNDAGGEGGEG